MKSRQIIVVIAATLVYSIIRYNIAGDVPLIDIPTFIVNKAVSFSIVVILAFSINDYVLGKTLEFKETMRIVKSLAIIHILLSVSLLSQQYYPKMFHSDKLTIFANIAVLSGVIATIYLFNSTHKMKTMIINLFIALHLFFVGAKGWLSVDKWHGLLPPISLLSFLVIVSIPVFVFFKQRQQPRVDSESDADQS